LHVVLLLTHATNHPKTHKSTHRYNQCSLSIHYCNPLCSWLSGAHQSCACSQLDQLPHAACPQAQGMHQTCQRKTDNHSDLHKHKGRRNTWPWSSSMHALAHSSHTAAATTAAAMGHRRLYTGYKGSPKHQTHTSRHKATGGRSSSMIGAGHVPLLGTARKWMSMPTGSPQHRLQDICRRYSSTARARKQTCKQ
jgi:hypothetical protein